MKTKLTITVDEDLVPRAKRYAGEQGISLSALIESSLRDIVGAEGQTFSERWRGGMTLREDVGQRYKALIEKYG